MQNTTQEVIDKPVVTKTAAQLLNALYYVWDAFDRAMVPFFLVHQTYKDAKNNHELSGDKVEVGIRRMEWLGGGRRMVDIFLGQPLVETEVSAQYEHNSVPILVHIYDDSPCITSLDEIVYRYENFKVPNPYSSFEKIYG